MDSTAYYSLLGSILLALIGILAKYWNDIAMARRKDRLERINLQLKFLYGPLYALSRASLHSWLAFNGRYRPDGTPFWGTPAPTDAEQVAWRTWMTTVFIPLNAQMAKVVRENTDLLDDAEMPACVLRLWEHVAAYQPMQKAWEDGDYSVVASVKFPYAIQGYTKRSFMRLKTEQRRLLGQNAQRHVRGARRKAVESGLPATPSSDRTTPRERE